MSNLFYYFDIQETGTVRCVVIKAVRIGAKVPLSKTNFCSKNNLISITVLILLSTYKFKVGMNKHCAAVKTNFLVIKVPLHRKPSNDPFELVYFNAAIHGNSSISVLLPPYILYWVFWIPHNVESGKLGWSSGSIIWDGGIIVVVISAGLGGLGKRPTEPQQTKGSSKCPHKDILANSNASVSKYSIALDITSQEDILMHFAVSCVGVTQVSLIPKIVDN